MLNWQLDPVSRLNDGIWARRLHLLCCWICSTVRWRVCVGLDDKNTFCLEIWQLNRPTHTTPWNEALNLIVAWISCRDFTLHTTIGRTKCSREWDTANECLAAPRHTNLFGSKRSAIATRSNVRCSLPEGDTQQQNGRWICSLQEETHKSFTQNQSINGRSITRLYLILHWPRGRPYTDSAHVTQANHKRSENNSICVDSCRVSCSVVTIYCGADRVAHACRVEYFDACHFIIYFVFVCMQMCIYLMLVACFLYYV